MFSQTAEYALRAVVWLANHTEAPLTTSQIASATQVPPDYLSKVLLALGRNGLVSARRGKNGGFTLSKPSDEITILDVINAVDPVQRIRTCPLRLTGHGAQLCPLHRRLDDGLRQIEETFRSAKISEFSGEQLPIAPLCARKEPAHA
jgi:Rrf2 family protein